MAAGKGQASSVLDDDEDDLWVMLKKYLFRKPTAEQLEARAKKIAILRQQQIEQFEINQTWNYVEGLTPSSSSSSTSRSHRFFSSSSKREIKQLKNITYRNIWMENNYLYDQIVANNPNERFHDVTQYALQWQPPGSQYRLLIPLNDKQIQVDAIKTMRFMTKKQISKILFYLTPIKGDMPLYAPNIHKSAYESFHDRSSVLKKLCEKYMQGVISVPDLHGILEAGFDTWKMALYNVLDAEEQQYHRYLLKPPPVLIKKSLERQYLDDEITLQQYDDAKHPIRKAKKDEEALSYPRPYTTGKCIVCSDEANGLIKCIDCDNLVCISCIQRVFLDENTSEGSFLLLHRKYCVRFGNLPNISVDLAPEPSYLHILRSTGIETTNSYLEHIKASKHSLEAHEFDEIEETLTGQRSKKHIIVDDDDEEDKENDEDSLLTSITNQLQQEIQYLLHIIEKCHHKLDAALGVLTEYQGVLDNPRRSQHLRERILRLKGEKIEKIDHTKLKIQQIKQKVKKYQNKGCNNYPELVKCFQELEDKEALINRFLESKSLQEFHENEEKLKELKASQMKNQLMMQYSFKK